MTGMPDRFVNGTQLAKLLADVPAERPYYAALARAIRGLILDGRLAPRTRLPAERDLATALGVSRTTVTALYDALRDEGCLESRRGAGSWAVLPRQHGRSRRGAFPVYWEHSVIDLGFATLEAPGVMDEAVAAAVAGLSHYTGESGYEPAGVPALRETIAARYTARGVPTRPEQIMTTGGAQHGIFLVLRALTTPGTAVLTESPTYPPALDTMRKSGLRLVPAGVNGGWDVELIASAMRQAAVRLVYTTPDFHNPTGQLMTDEQRAALVSAARGADARVLVDESACELDFDVAAMPRPMAAFDTDGRVICVGSASKLLWGGLRMGWIRASQPMIDRLVEARQTVDLASPVLEQLITRELLLRLPEVRAERRRVLLERRDTLMEALRERLPAWDFRVPGGGLSLWVRLPGEPFPASTALAETALRHGVRVVPGVSFGVDGTLDDRVRVPYVLPVSVLEEAVDRLARAWQETGALPALRAGLPAVR